MNTKLALTAFVAALALAACAKQEAAAPETVEPPAAEESMESAAESAEAAAESAGDAAEAAGEAATEAVTEPAPEAPQQ